MITDLAPLASLREAVPETVAAAVKEATGHGPVPPGLRQALRKAILHFLEPGSHPQSQVLVLFQSLGTTSASRGLNLRDVQAVQQAAVQASAVLLARRLRHADVEDVGPLVQRALVLIDRLKDAVNTGYSSTTALDPTPQQRELLDFLFGADGAPDRLKTVADQAGWPVPRALCTVAFASASAMSVLSRPGDVLADPVRRCLVVPDPDGPGRQAALERLLSGLTTAIGPTVPPAQATLSLRLARRALDLVTAGAITDQAPVHAMRHASSLTIMNSPELTQRLAEQQLAPIAGFSRTKQTIYLQTLHAWFECGSNIIAVADRLHVHPQTVRYRMARIEALFGPDLHDPGRTLDYLIALRAWTLMRGTTTTGIWPP